MITVLRLLADIADAIGRFLVPASYLQVRAAERTHTALTFEQEIDSALDEFEADVERLESEAMRPDIDPAGADPKPSFNADQTPSALLAAAANQLQVLGVSVTNPYRRAYLDELVPDLRDCAALLAARGE